jgi:hypothetical protein
VAASFSRHRAGALPQAAVTRPQRNKDSGGRAAIDDQHHDVTLGCRHFAFHSSFHRKNVHDQHGDQEHPDEKGDLKIPLGKSKCATAFALARRGLLQYSSWRSRLKRREITTAVPANYGFLFDCFGTVRAVFRPVFALGISRLSLHDQGVYYRDRP